MNSSACNKSIAPTKLPTGSGAPTFNRRSFVKRVLAAGAATNAFGLSSGIGTPEAKATPEEGKTSSGAAQRRLEAYRLRHDAAVLQLNQPLAAHPNNGDEALYPHKISSYSKGLPHNDVGEVDLNAYNALLHAVSTGDPAAFEAIPMGCPPPHRNLTNPQSGLAFEMEGGDAASFSVP